VSVNGVSSMRPWHPIIYTGKSVQSDNPTTIMVQPYRSKIACLTRAIL